MKSGFVVLAGRPNVGKSTLVNALCGSKVAIVSDKPQTTRRRVLGVVSGDGYELVLVDLPGFQRPRDALTERMQRTVVRSVGDADAVCLVLAGNERIGAGDRAAAERAFAAGVPVVIVVNKVDVLSPAEIAAQITKVAGLGDFHALHPVSAKTGDGIEELCRELVALLPEGPAQFSPDETTDQPLDLRIAELVREKALALTREEIPHSLAVDIEELTADRVEAVVLVETPSQKRILIGKGGSMIKEIGVRARPEIELLLGRPVFLDLRVKVKDKWRRNEAFLERLGI